MLWIHGCSLAVDAWVMTSLVWIPGWSFQRHTLSLSPHTARLYHTSLTSMEGVCRHTLGHSEHFVSPSLTGGFNTLHTHTLPNIPLRFFIKQVIQGFTVWTHTHPGVGAQKAKFPSFCVLFLAQSFHVTRSQPAAVAHRRTHTQWQDLPLQAPKVWWKCWECVLRGHWHFLHFLVLTTRLRHLMPRWLLPPDI